MKLTFYRQAAEPKRIDKTKYLKNMGSIENVMLTDESNLINPTFLMQTKEVVYNSNYVFCDFTNRYYFIDDITACTGGAVKINCTCDVLFTFRNEILASKAWIKTSGNTSVHKDFDLMHNDYPFKQSYDILGKDFTGGEAPFEKDIHNNYLLIIK